MQIITQEQWKGNPEHTEVSKYLISRFIQMVDNEDIISYQYPITNGMLLIKELYEVSSMCLKYPKVIKRFQSLLNECCNNNMKHSIVKDKIICKLIPDAVNCIKYWNYFAYKILKQRILYINQQLFIYLQYEQEYLLEIEKYFKGLELAKNNFGSDVEKGNIDCYLNYLIPHLISLGYSLYTLRNIAIKLPYANIHKLINSLFSEERLSLNIKVEENLPPLFFGIQTLSKIDDDFLHYLNADKLKPVDLQYNNEALFVYRFESSVKDIYNAFYQKIEKAYKQLISNYPDKNTDILINILSNSDIFYADNPDDIDNDKYRDLFSHNKSNTLKRIKVSTLSKTLDAINEKLSNFPDEIKSVVEESLYFYNLALNISSTSLESSYLLLWISLESMMGLRNQSNDIDNIKKNVASTLAIGAIGRRIKATIQRLKETLRVNSWQLDKIPDTSSENTEQGIYDWFEWLIKDLENKPNDPFNVLKYDPLLCMQYRSINEKWKTLENLRKIVIISKQKTSYQLDRLYLKRNQIVHKGKLEGVTESLWNHLEWYVGKILCQIILTLDEINKISPINSLDQPLDQVFTQLRNEYQFIEKYLQENKTKKITIEYIKNSKIAKFSALFV